MIDITAGSTDWSIRFFAFDSDGAAVTGLTHASAGMVASVVLRSKNRIVSTTALTLVARSGPGVHTDSALTEVGNGEYVIDLPDSYLATADRTVSLTVGATAITGSAIVESLTIVSDIVSSIATQITTDHGSGSYVRNTEPDNAGITAAAASASSADGKLTSGRLIRVDALPTASAGTTGGLSLHGATGDASQTTLLAVQTTVNTIASQTGQITGARLSVAGSVTPGGTIQLIVGKDYVTAASNGLTRSISDSGAALYDRLTSATLAAVKRFGASRPNGIAQITGTIASVTHASGMTSITIEIDRAAIPDSLTPAADYLYQIERETSDGDRVVEIEGTLTLSRRTV